MKYFCLLLSLLLLALPLAAQSNGNLQYIGDKAILHVWGSHFQRGHAQGYLLGQSVLDVFDQFYFQQVVWSDPLFYNYLTNYYLEHFDADARIYSEAQGIISGLQDAGLSLYHNALQRNLTADDVMQANAFLDMSLVRGRVIDKKMDLGCASLASWGVSTQQDSLLEGSAVLTRFLDWTQIDVLIANPLLIVHHPSEPDEQKWLTVTLPGWIGAPSAINAAGTWASYNVGNDHPATNLQGLDPVLFDARRGIERLDYNGDGTSDALDVHAALAAGNHLYGSIVHTLSEADGLVTTMAVETNNSGTVARYYDNNGNLPGNHLAATNHFRALTYPTCCTRYSNIQDSLYANPNVTAKRQLVVLSGAAGLETNLTALQYTPSTGHFLWSGATLELPAWQNPGITLYTADLFSFPVSASDGLAPALQPGFSAWPNPLPRGGTLALKSDFAWSTSAVYNLRGQKVFSQSLPSPQTEAALGLPDLPQGLYLLRLSTPEGKSSTRKLIIAD